MEQVHSGGSYLLLTTHYSLLTPYYSPLTTHCSLLTTYYLPLTTYYSLLTSHYLLEQVHSDGSCGAAAEVLRSRMLSHTLADALEHRRPADVQRISMLLLMVAADGDGVWDHSRSRPMPATSSEEDSRMADACRRQLWGARHLKQLKKVITEAAPPDAPPPELQIVQIDHMPGTHGQRSLGRKEVPPLTTYHLLLTTYV